MKSVKIKTTWGAVKLALDDSGKAVELILPPLKTAPRDRFSILSYPFSAPGVQTLEDLICIFPTAGIPAGTEFQQAVWKTMKKIPRGQTRTYGEIAAAIGHPKAARAVGSACGANPLPVFIPCHRVVAGNGLGGFGSGIPWKVLLLKTEGVL